MKKLAIITTCLAMVIGTSSASASVKIASLPEQIYNGHDFVGTIVAANYEVNTSGNGQNILITTRSDDANNESNLKAFAIKIDGKDLPFGLTLANAVGKKIAVIFSNEKYDIKLVQIITDEYWSGSLKE